MASSRRFAFCHAFEEPGNRTEGKSSVRNWNTPLLRKFAVADQADAETGEAAIRLASGGAEVSARAGDAVMRIAIAAVAVRFIKRHPAAGARLVFVAIVHCSSPAGD